MGNCLDTPAPPVERRRYADPARPSSMYQPYTLYPGYVRHNKFAGQPEYPAGRLSAYPVTSPYLPFDDRHSLSYDDWSAKQYYEQLQFRGQYGVLPPNAVPHLTNGVTRPANGVKHQTNGVAHRDKPKDTKNRQSTVIKTFPNPHDDVIKRGTQVILASSTAPVSLSINGKDAQQVPVSKETSGKRGSTYITYIQDPPPPPPEDEVKSSASSNHGEPEVVQTTSQVFQLFIDEPFSPPSSSLVKSSDTVTKMARKLPPKDVVLCYGSLDDTVTKVKKSMESAGLTVWLSRIKSITTDEDFQLAAQAVVNCKMLVVLLKSDTVNLRPLRDQVSLAQICDKVIFPVSVDLPLDVITTMEMGIKLQLGSYKWFELSSKNTLDLSILQMVRHVKEEISVIGGYDIIDEDFGQVSSKPRSEKISRQHKLKRMLYLGNHVTAAHFWDTHYGDLGPKVTWDRFLQDLRQAYRELINCSIPKSCHAHLDHVLRSELTFDGTVRKENFIEFCKDLGTDRDVWEVVHSVAMVTQAMRDVFDSNSTVRAVAINNIGKFLSSTILTCLRSLMADADPSIRSASVSTLATCIQATDHVSVKALVDSLDDGDHVVRLEACKAVARLKSQEAVEKLLLLWHNDVIPQVRHAAGAALTQIGGREVQQAMKSTNVQPAEVSQREYIISS